MGRTEKRTNPFLDVVALGVEKRREINPRRAGATTPPEKKSYDEKVPFVLWKKRKKHDACENKVSVRLRSNLVLWTGRVVAVPRKKKGNMRKLGRENKRVGEDLAPSVEWNVPWGSC